MLLPYSEFNRLLKLRQERITEEIKINPEFVDYDINTNLSTIYSNKIDYICYFYVNNTLYTLLLMYYPINNIETYHIIFTTAEQYTLYFKEFLELRHKGYITDDEHKYLDSIISKETNLNDVYKIFRKISWLIFDVHKKYIPEYKLSLVETTNYKKIKFYRDIIKNSFENVIEDEIRFKDHNYFIYEIRSIDLVTL